MCGICGICIRVILTRSAGNTVNDVSILVAGVILGFLVSWLMVGAIVAKALFRTAEPRGTRGRSNACFSDYLLRFRAEPRAPRGRVAANGRGAVKR